MRTGTKYGAGERCLISAGRTIYPSFERSRFNSGVLPGGVWIIGSYCSKVIA